MPYSYASFLSRNMKKYAKHVLYFYSYLRNTQLKKNSVDRVWVGIVTSRVETSASLGLYPPEVGWWLHCVHSGHSDQPRPDLTLSPLDFTAPTLAQAPRGSDAI